MKLFAYNSIREKLKKTLFTALKVKARDFIGVSVKHSHKILTLAVLLVFVGNFLLSPQVADSMKPEAPPTFGKSEVLRVYPSAVDGLDFERAINVLVPDLSENALYQNYSNANSAYISLPSEESGIVPSVATGSAPTLSDENVDTSLEEQGQSAAESLPANLDADTSVHDSNASSSVSWLPSVHIKDVASALFTFVEKASASTTELTEPVSADEEPVLTEDVVDEVSSHDSDNHDHSDPTQVHDHSHGDETPAFQFVQDVDSPEEIVSPGAEQATTSDSDGIQADSESVVEDDIPVDEATTSPEVLVEPTASTSPEEVIATSTLQATTTEEEVVSSLSRRHFTDHTISLSDFSIPDLRPGEEITGLQLRTSIGAQYRYDESSAMPEFRINFKNASTSQVVGAIPFTDEFSNAINGGYQLFALPQIEKVSDLDNVKVDITFSGDLSKLEGAFIDSVWLEITTKVISRDDLDKKHAYDLKQSLKSPESHDFVSEKLDFTRDEAPIFNLRYRSQRALPVEAVREFFGLRKIKVNEVKVLHNASGLIGIEPEVSVTHDGLVNIAVPEDQKHKLKPGQYTVEISLNEGGKMVVDSFDFQWGMLSINTLQTQYAVGDEVSFAMGALTPNGNTLCEADLRLYVIDSLGGAAEVPVNQSGLCDGNNVIDVPDYMAAYIAEEPDMYTMYLERIDENGAMISYTEDTFEVVVSQEAFISRNGPTRIYPPSPYPMELTVETTNESFVGKLIERVPADFSINNTDAKVVDRGEYLELQWDVSVLPGQKKTVSYNFDAPDISPYLYKLGPARLVAGRQGGEADTASSTKSKAGDIAFEEHRQWQIASDAVGNMILFWDDGLSIPAGWTCLSCGSGTFYQRFGVGSSTYNNTGGSATHGHTAVGSVLASASAATESGAGTIAPTGHTHTYSPTIGATSSLPAYRQLRVIQYTGGAGEPTTIPQGAIGIFDVASSSLPSGWTRYEAQDGYYVYGEDTPGTTGGDNVHTHGISGTTGAAAGVGTRVRGGGTQASGASDTHTHTVSSTTPRISNEPPYIEVLFAKIGADGAPPNNLISMWTEDVPSGWIDVSSAGGDPFNNRFIKASTTYGGTGGSESHAHADMTGIVSSAPSATINGRTGSAGSSGSHTHNVSVTGFSTTNSLPPYVSVVFGKRQGTDPVYDQLSYRWYANEDAITPTDPWPAGVDDLDEGETIAATSTEVAPGDEIRLRINAEVTNATSTAGSEFKLQFAAASVCSSATGWADVGDTASSTAWRGYNNASVADHATLPSQLLASSTVSQTYEENGYSTTTPNDISVDAVGEWDFVLENNSALAGTEYCFRMVENDGTAFALYSDYPKLLTNASPVAPTLSRLFDNEKIASTTGVYFRFVSTDPEGEGVHYQVQIDNNYDFSSTLEDRNSISNASQFENLVDGADKAPFSSGELMQYSVASTFTNGTTYYWRVRGQDPDGSNEWGDWSTIYSFTIDTSLTASAWFQTEDEQFDTNVLEGTETGGDDVDLATGSTTGTTTSTAVTFSDGLQGTAWESFEFTDNEASGDIKYRIQYYTDGAAWADVPDGDLSGNSAGFDTSPVNLLGLDVEMYDVIRVVAVFTDAGGSPILQDWTINWGYLVETPTISRLFPNEKTGTTTPLFEFTTTDPQSDDLTYQVSWSTDYAFGASTTRTSDTDLGFSNFSDGGDTDPFTSGDTIQFQMQGGDALANNTTYWWRVRAKDTTGDNTYSFWTEPQSFTVDTTVIASTWFQTTEEQFDTDVLSGTIALASDAVAVATTAVEAMLVYGEGTASSPKYRLWDGSVWSAEGDMQDVGSPVRWAKVRAGTNREEYVAATVGTDGDVNAQVYALGVWDDLQEVTTSMGDVNLRGFDVAYETLSGDAMVAYCDGDADPSYYIWDGSTWTSGGTINVAETTNCEWLQLASDPVSDEIIVLTRGEDGNPYEAQVWSGSVWGNSTTLGSVTETAYEGMSVIYEESGGQAMVVTSDGNPARFTWNTWSGAAWGTAGTVTLGDDFEWGTLAADTGSDDLALCYVDHDEDIGTAKWNGSAWSWAASDEHTATGKTKTEPSFSCVFEDGGSRDNYILTAYSDTTQTNYTAWNGSTWSTAAQVQSIGDTITSELQRTGAGAILGIFFDDTNDDLLFSEWNGSTWSTTQTIENDASVDTTPFGRPYSLIPRNSATEGTVIVSPALNFSDGSGPYWKEMSWVDSTPGSSDILYSVQYYDGDSWEFIPDGDILGNAAGTTTSPIDLSGLNVSTYATIRPYAALSCDGASSCPELQDWTIEWAEGINISGSLQQYDQSTAVSGATIGVAVNGVLEVGKTGTSDVSGNWSIPNVTAFSGDVITVFVSGASDTNEAVSVTRYDGSGDIFGFQMFERHVALGSDDATSTPLTNADIALYNSGNTEDVFLNISGSTLDLCTDAGCHDVEFYINASTTYNAGGNLITHDVGNNGVFVATTTLYVDGSWDDNATSTLAGSTVIFSATSTTESIDQTGAVTPAFNNVTFGTTTGAATWNLTGVLDVDGDLTTERGTLSRGTFDITVAGSLTNGANGLWSGTGTTTFDGGVGVNWGDQNASLQNIGYVVVDGSGKIVTLNGNVAAQSVTIGGDDVLDASASNYDITVYESWTNNNSFVARAGEVIFAATTAGHQITAGGDDFYDATFNGVDGTWSFTEAALTISNDLTVATGTVTLPTATTSLGGSFSAAGGTFAHNNSAIDFTSSGAETITASGTAFTNIFYDLYFSGSGSWTFNDVNATATNSFHVTNGSVALPTGVLAIGGSISDTGGSFTGSGGAVQLYSGGAESILAGGSTFSNLLITGAGTFTFTDTNASIADDLTLTAGTLVLPSGTLSIGGSLSSQSTIDANSGQVTFNSTDAGETIDVGTSNLYDVLFSSATGGWTLVSHATATNNLDIDAANDWTLSVAQTLSVGGVFTNSVGGASTTWTGSVLSLEAGAYNINTKSDAGDSYETLRIAANTDVSMWNSVAATYSVDASSSLYSQDHNAINGDLYIFGDYQNNGGNEYWSYATDFDGADLGTTSPRQVDVRLATGASVTVTGGILEVIGTSTASTTIANQGAGTYVVSVSGGTTTAQYYEFADLGLSGLSLLASTTVTSLLDGSYTVAAGGGTAITVSSTTIDTNPAFQIYNVTFATTTAIAATNVTQTDGAPASYWWFRESAGNLQGEAFDLDPDAGGNPGTIRWDDSALVVTISGAVYQDDEVTPLTGGTCDGAALSVRVVVEEGATYDGSCSAADGSYSIAGVTVVGDPTVTVYLNDASGGEIAVAQTKTVTADVTDLDLYENRVIIRHEDVNPMTIDDMAAFDNDDDSDIPFTAATTTDPDLLTVFSNTELHVWATSTFTPGGDITLYANASADTWDGTLHLGQDAVFTGAGTSTYTIGGSIDMESGATFVPASTVVVMNATTTGKTINTATDETLTLNELQFTGVGGGWNLNGNASTTDDVTVAAGTLTGTGNLTVLNGSFSGNGTVSFGGGTTTITHTNIFGGTEPWTLHNLTLGSGVVVGTTTPAGSATTTVSGTLTISNAHFLDAGSSQWLLTGSGDVFVETGTFLEDTSRVTYGGTAAMNVLSADYYNLTFDSPAGSPVFTAVGPGIQVFGDLKVGNTGVTTVNFDTNDPALNVDGDLLIMSNGTFIASDSGAFTLAGSYDNDGVFTASGGEVQFDGVGAETIAAGDSSFADVTILGTGTHTITEHATATGVFTIATTSTGFTVNASQRLAVGGTLANNLGGAGTTWTDSVLHLFGGGNYEINASTTNDSYATLDVAAGTQIRMWNSDASTTTTAAGGSVYSMDHTNTNGDLYIYGDYSKAAGTDYWNYATDFDGTDLTGSERMVDVYVEGGSTITYNGGSLEVTGDASASTTVQNQGSGTYAFDVSAGSFTAQYYVLQDMDADGLTFTGAPTVSTLSNGHYIIGVNNGQGITVAGSVIDTNPAKNFSSNIFATSSGVTTAFNASTTGSTVSSWRFTLHAGDVDGESFDRDNGDPGYLVWDDSVALITISGRVYENDESTVSSVCDDVTTNIVLAVEGVVVPAASSTCASATGLYSISNVSFSPNDTLTLFINGEADDGVTVSIDPISSVGNMDIYEDHVIVRHEGTDAILIDDMADYDSGDDADIPFTATVASPDTLTLNANTKLIVWDSKTFEPQGDITTGGGAGGVLDGTVELQDDAVLTLANGESHSIGGNLEAGVDAVFTPAQSLVTFTSTGSGRTIDTNESGFYDVVVSGSGSFTSSDTVLLVGNDMTLSAGSLVLPAGTTTISGSLSATVGTFDANDGIVEFDSGAAETVVASSSEFSTLIFSGAGSWVMNDVHATATDSVTIESGTLTLPSGTFTVGGSFINEAGNITHNTSELIISTSSTAFLQASSSSLYGVTFEGGGTFSMLDEDLALLDTLTVSSGALTLASGTLSIGGSFDAAGGTFNHASGTILFNSGDAGETIDPGPSSFNNVVFGNASGGWTISDHATTTGNFTLTTANSFTLAANAVLAVEGVFTNSVGGAATTWTNSELKLLSGTDYSINTKSSGGDVYEDLFIAANMDVSSWNSVASDVSFGDYTNSSLYSKDHSAVDGNLYIYGTYAHATGTEYWSYATDFDGTSLSGSERAVDVFFVAAATSSFSLSDGTLNILGADGSSTTVQSIGAGTYSFAVSGGTFNAQYYEFSGFDSNGINFSGSPVITSLNDSSFEVGVNTGTAITLAHTAINANASKVITNVRFATTTAISANNVTVSGVTTNYWRFQGEYGNISGEAYDVDGGDACGAVRWDDSSCMLLEQTHYRWRNDDGGLGVRAGEWYDTDWGKRKSVRLENDDATTYSNAVVEIEVAYDADMQSDFDDLRFTTSDGVTPIDFFVASATASVAAEVWLEVPSLEANETSIFYMYYDNTTATSAASSTATFIAADDFEDNNISEYSGDTGLFNLAGTYAYGGSYGLDNAGNTGSNATDGIARFDQTMSQGETLRFVQYMDTSAGSDNETCVLFGVQSPVTGNQNYGVCLIQYGTDRISIVKDAERNDSWGGVSLLASSTATYSTGWYEVEVDWGTDDSIFVSLYDDNETLVATTTATDSTYTSGGYGFTYWGNDGGWDNYTSRPTLTNEPSVTFGAEAVSGGATWAAAQDTLANFDGTETARLRVAIENTGLAVTNQTFDLEYADKGASPTCESVSGASFAQVPVQSSCGTSPICMKATAQYADNDATVDLLMSTNGIFVAGEGIEDPSDTTGNINLNQYEFTEVEYALEPTVNAVSDAYCFRVTNNGSTLDSYGLLPELQVTFDPILSGTNMNGGFDVALTAGTTTQVYATATVTDLNGTADLRTATATMYRSGVGAACAADLNNCYIEAGTSTCSFINCSGNTCTLSCVADFAYHADPTDAGAYSGEEWFAFLEVEDYSGGVDFDTSSGVEVMTLRALDIDNTIAYGSLLPNDDTGAFNPSTPVKNYGNEAIDVDVSGTDMIDGGTSSIAPTNQLFSTTTFTYAACASCSTLTALGTNIELDLVKPTTTTPYLQDVLYWGIQIPFGTAGAVHTGTNTFTAVGD